MTRCNTSGCSSSSSIAGWVNMQLGFLLVVSQWHQRPAPEQRVCVCVRVPDGTGPHAMPCDDMMQHSSSTIGPQDAGQRARNIWCCIRSCQCLICGVKYLAQKDAILATCSAQHKSTLACCAFLLTYKRWRTPMLASTHRRHCHNVLLAGADDTVVKCLADKDGAHSHGDVCGLIHHCRGVTSTHANAGVS